MSRRKQSPRQGHSGRPVLRKNRPLGSFCVLMATMMTMLDTALAIGSSTRLVDIFNDHDVEHQQRSEETIAVGTLRGFAHTGNTKSDEDEVDDIYEGTVTQILDHFRLGGDADQTFAQRYFYTDRYVNLSAPRQYAFLCVGGEGPALEKAVLRDSVHCTGDMLETARRLYEQDDGATFSIHLYALEHRYYGKSYPVFENSNHNDDDDSSSPVTNENLVYLSSRQAQADLAHFVSVQNTQLGNNALPWITFGGSYPGMMAAFARLRFPHYIAAAVSSSAPIQPLLDFAGYKNHVGKVLNDTKVGGSPACLQVFIDGHAQVAEQVKDRAQHAQVIDDFGLCPARKNSTASTSIFDNPRNVQLFLGDGLTQVGTQGNDPSCSAPLCNIAKKCAAVLEFRNQGDTAAQALARLERQRKELKRQGSLVTKNDDDYQPDSDCTNISWEDSIAFLSDTSYVQGGWRSWLWQTCTEFGFYQTCNEESACPFGRGYHPVSMDLEICQRAFGVKPTSVIKAVQESMQYYGGWHLGATRVLSVNGDVDPWSELALLRTIRHDLPAFVVPGASHHFWTHAVKETDSVEVQGARELIFATIKGWLDDIDAEWSLRPVTS